MTDTSNLIGATITDVRHPTKKELSMFSYDNSTIELVVELDNGSTLIPAQDPELNGIGHLVEYDKDGKFVSHYK